MADWLNITDTQVDPDAPLTSQLAYAWRDNPIAIAEGASGAPRIVRSALKTATSSVSGTLGSGLTVKISLNQYSFFPDIMAEAGVSMVGGIGTASVNSASFTLKNDSPNPEDYSVAWRYVNT